jgi:pSer/pThr/pTyr-binding forkhead associated (FHA) protein
MIVCHVCGTENPDGAKFCEGCGVELGATPVASSVPAPAATPAPTMPPVEPTPAFTSNTPVEQPPLEGGPVEVEPLEAAPIDAAPIDATPAQRVPVEAPPLESDPVILPPVVTPPPAPEPDIKATMAGLDSQPVAASAKPKVARLVPRAVGSSGEGYVLSSDHMVVGRFDPSAGPVDIDLGGQPGEGYISRRHAEVYAENGVWMVRDLGSTNGVYVKRAGQGQYSPRIIEPTALGDGDEVAFGNVKFLFLNSSEA